MHESRGTPSSAHKYLADESSTSQESSGPSKASSAWRMPSPLEMEVEHKSYGFLNCPVGSPVEDEKLAGEIKDLSDLNQVSSSSPPPLPLLSLSSPSSLPPFPLLSLSTPSPLLSLFALPLLPHSSQINIPIKEEAELPKEKAEHDPHGRRFFQETSEREQDSYTRLLQAYAHDVSPGHKAEEGKETGEAAAGECGEERAGQEKMGQEQEQEQARKNFLVETSTKSSSLPPGTAGDVLEQSDSPFSQDSLKGNSQLIWIDESMQDMPPNLGESARMSKREESEMYEDDFEDDSTERQVSEQFGGSGDPFPEGGERDKEIAGAGKECAWENLTDHTPMKLLELRSFECEDYSDDFEDISDEDIYKSPDK